MTYKFNPKLDLKFERTIDTPVELLWKAWTNPEQLKKWFCPLPWKTVECEIDLRPGGNFSTVMISPQGEKFPNKGCYLEVIENKKLIWTNTLLEGYRPAPISTSGTNFFFTAIIELETFGKGTKYSATVIHGNEEDRKKHEQMGFQEGWGMALDQLIELAKIF